MDKRTILIFAVYMFVFAAVFSIQQCTTNNSSTTTAENVEETVQVVQTSKTYYTPVFKGEVAKTFDFETDTLKVTFDTTGASVKAIVLKNETSHDGEVVNFVFKGENDNNAFLMYWGDNLDSPVLENFNYKISGKKVIFTKSFKDSNGKEFEVVKTFEFKDGEYLFAVNVQINGLNANGDYAYTLAYEPQVGPSFTTMKNNNYDYRRFYVGLVKKNGQVKRTAISLKNNKFESNKTKDNNQFNWISLTSKYYTVVARPENTNVDFKLSAYRSSGDIVQTDGIFVSVPSNQAKDQTIYFYCGPQLKKYLGKYYNASDNAWGIKNYNLDDAMESSSALGWLETALKWVLQLLHKIVPNYGICIIILTIILKLALWPLQQKGTESTAKMSAIQPQIQEIQEKYKDNTQKQNIAMQALYKEYGIKPLGGCFPMLIRFPILIAFYGLLNRHYELRGAMFIPGWISDLSIPETVATLSFRMPLLGNEIHLLPIIYTASMIFSMKFTQSSSQVQSEQQKSTMWFMTWGMPIMFFFVLYSAPSGLLLYWTCQNGLSILQQILTNKKVSSGKLVVEPVKQTEQKKEPEAIRKYQEKLKKLEEASKNNKKGK